MKKLSLLFLTAVMSIALVACGGDGATDNSDNADDADVAEEAETEETDEAETEEAESTLTVGDTAEFDDAKFTLKAVNTTDERNEFAETDPTTVIGIEYELENISDEDLSYGMDITVYDAD